MAYEDYFSQQDYSYLPELEPEYQQQPSYSEVLSRRLTPRQQMAATLRQSGANLAGGRVSEELSPLQGINLQYRTRTGAPVYQRGISQLYGMDIPTALAQQLAYEQAVNAGRVNVGKQYLGQGAATAERPYVSYEPYRQYFRGLRSQYAGQGALNPYTDVQQRQRALMEEGRQYMYTDPYHARTSGGRVGSAIPELNVGFERRNVGGAIMDERINPLERIRRQEDQLRQGPYGGVITGREGDLRRQRALEADQRQRVFEQMRELEQMQPTTSNLPIEERYIR